MRIQRFVEQTLQDDVPIKVVVDELRRLDMPILAPDMPILAPDMPILAPDMPILAPDMQVLGSDGLNLRPDAKTIEADVLTFSPQHARSPRNRDGPKKSTATSRAIDSVHGLRG